MALILCDDTCFCVSSSILFNHFLGKAYKRQPFLTLVYLLQLQVCLLHHQFLSQLERDSYVSC